jgi:hypothetical protein
MEMSQGNSLCSYLKQTKMSFFKSREQEGESGPVWGLAPVGEGGHREKGEGGEYGRILCTHKNGKK